MLNPKQNKLLDYLISREKDQARKAKLIALKAAKTQAEVDAIEW